ncbi:MAG: exosortase C-terminal domain/associated protein EpsI [Bryobacteraceae bacterium]|jgi:EpsI family protein
MAESSGTFRFLKGTPARVLTAVLLLQLAGFVAVSRRETVPLARPLSEFPSQLGAWSLVRESEVDQETMEVLRADDVLSRVYSDPVRGRAASLFVAYFKSQRTGQAPHSPKNCLPGAGWTPSESDVLAISVPGRAQPILVNRYLVSKGEDKSVVLYWYQSRNRVVASEYRAKIYLVTDAIRYNRTDTALVRVIVPVAGNDSAAATTTAEEFVQAFFMTLRRHLPA